MTKHDRSETAGDFLRVWYVLAEAHNTSQLERWERQFPELAEASPDMTLEILRELATSNAPGAKEAAAIYARFTFDARQEETTDLLMSLYQGGDPEIQSRLLDTIDVITTDKQLNPTQTAGLITAVKAR